MENLPSPPPSDSTRNYTVPSTVDYFYGRLLREDAQEILKNRSESLGINDGLFLLRESMDEIGNYALSIFHYNEITHYKICRDEDCKCVLLNRGIKSKPFNGPIELIEHLKKEPDNLLINQIPKIPCSRPRGIQPINYLFVSDSDLHNQVNEEIKRILQDIKSDSQIYNQKLLEAKTVRRYVYEKNILKNLQNLNQLAPAWFKENCSGIKAKKILKKHKYSNGTFLVRTYVKKKYWSNTKKTVILLSIIIDRKMKNYEIKSSDDKFYIVKHEKFDSIPQLIDFYYRSKNDNKLPFKLESPVLTINMYQTNLYLYSQIYESKNYYDRLKLYLKGEYTKLAAPGELLIENFLKSLSKERRDIYEQVDYYSVIYDIQQSDLLNSKNLKLETLIDRGNFGEVYFGTYKYKTLENEPRELPVAVKKLNLNSKQEIQNEANLMKSLDSPYIIKYLGLCYTTANKIEYLNIVLEFAKLGSLYGYLGNHEEFPMIKIAKILYQIASAMEYLASKKIVHRDLASRNVLLVDANSAKVSDFGLSRLTNSDGEYMQDLSEKKWPFRWFSPELMESGIFR
jgi:hypothetical protein